MVNEAVGENFAEDCPLFGFPGLWASMKGWQRAIFRSRTAHRGAVGCKAFSLPQPSRHTRCALSPITVGHSERGQVCLRECAGTAQRKH